MIDDDRARRLGDRGGLDPELHRLRAGDGRARARRRSTELGLQVQWQQVEDGPRERARHVARRGRRADADVQRAHRHLVLRAASRGSPGSRASSRRGSSGTGGIYGLGISNMKGALACYVEAVRALQRRGRAAARRRDRRGRRRRDREDAVGRRAGRRVPRLRGRLALPRRARRRRGHVHPRRADREQARARRTSARSGCGSRRSGPFIHTAFFAAGSRRTRSCGCASVLDARARVAARRGRRRCRYGDVRGVANVGAIQGGFGWRVVADAARDRPLPRPARAADVADGRARGARRSSCALGARRRRGRDLRDRAGREIEEEHPLVARSTRRTPRSSARRPSAT